MNPIRSLEFEQLTVIDTDDGSSKYLLKTIQGPKLECNTTVMVGEFEFDIDNIIYEVGNKYRLVNSNSTLLVEIQSIEDDYITIRRSEYEKLINLLK